jgi:hypothetical protein
MFLKALRVRLNGTSLKNIASTFGRIDGTQI